MDNIIKYGLLAGAAYLAYNTFLAPVAVAASPAAGNPAGTPTASPLLTTINALGAGGPNLLSIAAKLPAASKLNVSQWNYYLTQVTNLPGVDLTGYLPGVTLTSTYTVADYWQGLTNYAQGKVPTYTAGVNGISNLGMGEASALRTNSATWGW